MFKEMTLQEFTDQVASSSPIPGGGSVAGVAGSIAASLICMVTNLTIGREKFAGVDDEMKKTREQAEMLRAKLFALADEDSEVYNIVMKAYGLPKATQEEKTARTNQIQEALVVAAKTPLQTAKTALEALRLVKFVFENGNQNANSDAKVAAVLLRSAVLSAVFNVEINLSSIKNQEIKTALAADVAEVLAETKKLEEEIFTW